MTINITGPKTDEELGEILNGEPFTPTEKNLVDAAQLLKQQLQLYQPQLMN